MNYFSLVVFAEATGLSTMTVYQNAQPYTLYPKVF